MDFSFQKTRPFLGGSPDGLTEKGCLVEVKKVTSKDGESKEDTLCRLAIYKQINDSVVLVHLHSQLMMDVVHPKHVL